MPEIVLKKEFIGDEADDLAACFNAGVIIVEQGGDGVRRAKVGDARGCTMTREVHRYIRHLDFFSRISQLHTRALPPHTRPVTCST